MRDSSPEPSTSPALLAEPLLLCLWFLDPLYKSRSKKLIRDIRSPTALTRRKTVTVIIKMLLPRLSASRSPLTEADCLTLVTLVRGGQELAPPDLDLEELYSQPVQVGLTPLTSNP